MDRPSSQLTIAPPDPTMEPRKANIYEFSRAMNSQLASLFSYDGPGALVASAVVMDGASENPGYFIHENSQDEIALCFGSRGARFRTGQVAVNAKVHGVSGLDPADDAFQILVIVQRQSEGPPQTERIAFVCEKCQAELFSYRFEVVLHGRERYAPLDTICGSHRAAMAFNGNPQKHTCPSCGHVNSRFPEHLWGWKNYVRQTAIATACASLLGAALPSQGGE